MEKIATCKNNVSNCCVLYQYLLVIKNLCYQYIVVKNFFFSNTNTVLIKTYHTFHDKKLFRSYCKYLH